MKSAQDYWNDANKLVNEINTLEKSKTLTRQNLIQNQKLLRLLKKEVVSTKKIINAQYETQKQNSSPGLISSLLLGRGTARSINASNKRGIQNKKLQATHQYDQVIRIIDNAVLQIENMKLKLDEK